MSYWKAYALARKVPEGELREALIAAYETVEDRDADLETSRAELEEAQDRASDAEEKLAEHESAEDGNVIDLNVHRLQLEVKALRDQNAFLREDRNSLRAQIADAAPLADSYAGLLSFARRFVSAAEASAVKAKHVRQVGGVKKGSTR